MSTTSSINQLDIEDTARRMNDRFRPLSDVGGRIAVAVYRLLALGGPVFDSDISEATGLDIEVVKDEMEDWPGVYRNEAAGIVGFWGLSVVKMDHAMDVAGRELYGWCAWDTLFLPGVLGQEARVRSSCAETGEEIVITVAADGVKETTHPGAVVSMVDADAADVEGDRVISSFCHHILFFRSRQDGEAWAARREDAPVLLAVDEGFELGRAWNELRLGSAL